MPKFRLPWEYDESGTKSYMLTAGGEYFSLFWSLEADNEEPWYLSQRGWLKVRRFKTLEEAEAVVIDKIREVKNCLLEQIKQINKMIEVYDEPDKLFVVRLYDRYDGYWIDVSKPVTREEAEKLWNKETKNGTKNTQYEEGSYYQVFPADTKMAFDGPERKMNHA